MRIAWSRLLVFLGVLGTASALLHGYAWRRVAIDPGWSEPLPALLTASFVLLALALPAAMFGTRLLPPRLAVPAAWGAYIWLGTLFYLDVTLLALDLSRLAFESVAYASVSGPWLQEGAAASRAVASLAMATTLGLVTGGLTRGLSAPTVRRVRVKIDGLPAAFEGFRIVQLTDVHV